MRAKKECTAPERWRNIPGFNGLYQASTEGRIRKVWPKSGKVTLMQMYTHKRRSSHSNSVALRVHLTMPNGKRIERTVIRLVAETFFVIPEGSYPVHRDGSHSNNSVSNIILLSSQELGERFGDMSSRRPVVKITVDGEIVDCYSSARAAARKNYLSYQTVIDRCNKKVKNEFALTGYSYRWDD